MICETRNWSFLPVYSGGYIPWNCSGKHSKPSSLMIFGASFCSLSFAGCVRAADLDVGGLRDKQLLGEQESKLEIFFDLTY